MNKFKISTIICFLFISLSLFADSFSLSTGISSVSTRGDFGMGLFPAGTGFRYYDSFQMIENLPKATFDVSVNFSFSNASFGSYTWDSGIPLWSIKYKDRTKSFISGSYFRPTSSIDVYLQQGFGKNPVTGSAPLVIVRGGFNTRFAMAVESLAWSSTKGNKYVFVDELGKPKPQFGPNTVIPAFPWLQDSRKTWNNYLYLSTYWYFQKSVALDSYEGVYAELTMEYGPWWLANYISPKGKTSDFYRIYAFLREMLPLYVDKQESGRNWLNIYLGHSNAFNYYGGDIMPEHKIPGDRLRANVNDRIWLRFTGPQFIASDCYTYFDIALNNTLYFGNVVNEASQQTKAIELQSSINGTFHLRLFGFMRFQYTFGYNMARGIHASYPAWSQRADLQFYVSI